MIKKKRFLSLFLVVFVLLVMVLACKVTDPIAPAPPPPATDTPTALFNHSGHADKAAEAWVHWNGDTPPMVPTGCAKCHSAGGYLDYLDNGVVNAAQTPGTLNCGVCHADSTRGITHDLGQVVFPSGVVVANLGPEAICMNCHQGRQSTPSMNAYLTRNTATVEDRVYTALGFQNVHYFAAGATLYGKVVHGGYEYTGAVYDAKFAHAEGYDSCTDCHNPHSLEVKVQECTKCHAGVNASNLHDIRHYGSMTDYDGDGDRTEGIYYELQGIREHLYNALWAYAKNVSGIPIVFNDATNPYFFYDTNENGICDTSEAVSSNAFKRYTPRLLKAAYNYQFSKKDTGAFAHGGKYVIQLLIDSLQSVNGANPNPIPLPVMSRDDEGHFDGAAEAWRHWDVEGDVPAGCSKCHAPTGLATFLETGVTAAIKPGHGLMCSNCHAAAPATRQNVRDQEAVTFPSGAVLTLDDHSNLCLNCHQGRAAKSTIDKAIAANAGPYSFTNIHYFPSAAVLFGTDAKGGYEYAGRTYAGRKMFLAHGGDFDTCIECHMGTKGQDEMFSHNVRKPNPADCVICHGRDVSEPNPGWDAATFKFGSIRPQASPDYDADNIVTESLKSEIAGLQAALYAELLNHSKRIGAPLVYSTSSYPYFFKDLNGNGLLDDAENKSSNGYKFTAALLKAAYNYHMTIKEPYGFIHNSMYVAQLLVDSIWNLGGNVSKYTWR